MEILNVTDTSDIALVGTLSDTAVGDIEVVGSVAYVAGDDDSSEQFSIVNISNTALPVVISSRTNSGYSQLDVEGNFSFVTDNDDGIDVYNISNNTATFVETFDDLTGYTRDVFASDENTIFIAGSAGLVIGEKGDTGFVNKAVLSLGETTYGVVVKDRFAYVVGVSGLHVVYIGNLSSPVIVGKIDLNATAYKLELDDKYVQIAAGTNGLVTVQIAP